MNTILTPAEREEIFQRCADADEEVVDRYGRAIEAAVLAKLRQQKLTREPVGTFKKQYWIPGSPGVVILHMEKEATMRDGDYVYAAPLPAVVQVPLSEKQISRLYRDSQMADASIMLRSDYERGIRDAEKAHGITAAPEAPAQGIPAELDVRRILLDVVPGDGDGFEVYAKSVADVESKLGKMGEELEEWQLGIRRYAAPEAQAIPAPWRETVKVAREALNDMNDSLQEIAELAHGKSTGPAVWDEYWNIRNMAYNAMNSAALAQLDALEGGE